MEDNDFDSSSHKHTGKRKRSSKRDRMDYILREYPELAMYLNTGTIYNKKIMSKTFRKIASVRGKHILEPMLTSKK
jgi:hypothetical protein